MKALGVIVACIAFMAASAILRGWALVTLWAWFVVPMFALPPLTIPYAIGLGIVVVVLTMPAPQGERPGGSKRDAMILGCTHVLALPICAVAMGAIVRLWV